MEQRVKPIKPGFFSKNVSADSRRNEFDTKNEIIVTNNVPIDFVFIGDSITHRWELNAYFGGSCRRIINRGIGGDHSEYALKRFTGDVLQLKPRYAVLAIGINDTWVLEDTDWIKDYANPAEYLRDEIVSNIAAMAEMSKNQGMSLLICSILPTNLPTNPKGAERNELVVEANCRLKDLASKYGFIYVDYHANMAAEDGKTLRDGLSDDGVHPHSLGYNVMSRVLRETLVQNGIEI